MDFAFALNREIDKLSSLELIFLSTTVITNIFCTIAIIYRIVAVSGWRKSLKTYWRLIEILVESSLLYTAVYVIRIGLQIHTQSFTEGLDERVLFPRALGYSIAVCAPTTAASLYGLLISLGRELPQRWLSPVWRRASQDLTILGRVHPFRIWGRPRGLWLRVCILLDRASALSWTRISLPLSGALGRRGTMKASDRRQTVVVLLNRSQTKRRHRFLYKSSSPRLL